MILLDTNVLIDAFNPNSPHHRWAADTLHDALVGSGAAANTVILAELMVGDTDPATVAQRLAALGVALMDLPTGSALRCAAAYECYLRRRRSHGDTPPPKCPLPDFFIGAHASILELPLATSDTGRYSTYFPEVQLLTPCSA